MRAQAPDDMQLEVLTMRAHTPEEMQLELLEKNAAGMRTARAACQVFLQVSGRFHLNLFHQHSSSTKLELTI